MDCEKNQNEKNEAGIGLLFDNDGPELKAHRHVNAGQAETATHHVTVGVWSEMPVRSSGFWSLILFWQIITTSTYYNTNTEGDVV